MTEAAVSELRVGQADDALLEMELADAIDQRRRVVARPQVPRSPAEVIYDGNPRT